MIQWLARQKKLTTLYNIHTKDLPVLVIPEEYEELPGAGACQADIKPEYLPTFSIKTQWLRY